VIDDEGHVVGVISEADLIRREEIGTGKHRRCCWKRSRRRPRWPMSSPSRMAGASAS
jgi:hypothetical protein